MLKTEYILTVKAPKGKRIPKIVKDIMETNWYDYDSVVNLIYVLNRNYPDFEIKIYRQEPLIADVD